MDLLTQGLLGSSLALSAANKDNLRKGALIGLIAGLSADIDFFISSDSDPLLNLEYHRHFTHSLLFIPLAAVVLSLLLWPLFRSSLRYRQLLLFCALGYLFSGFLDACTSYGTSLLWPLSEQRFSFNIISIVDPIFTLLLLFAVGWGVMRRQATVTRVFLLLAAGYLLLGTWQKITVQQIVTDHAQQQGQRIERLLVKPTLGNLWLWRAVYQFDGHYHINAVRLAPLFGEPRIFPGSRIAVFEANGHDLVIAPESVLQRDIERFAHFSDHYLARHPEDADVVFDVRYANLPNSYLPLWGIRLNTAEPQTHARYELYRDKSAATRQAFFDMLLDR